MVQGQSRGSLRVTHKVADGIASLPRFSLPTEDTGGCRKASPCDVVLAWGRWQCPQHAITSFTFMQSVLVSEVQRVLRSHLHVLEFSLQHSVLE